MSNCMDTLREMQEVGLSATVFTNAGGAFNNGHICIANDVVFGLCVWDGKKFFPISMLDADDVQVCKTHINMGTHPFPWWDEFNKIIK